MGYDEIYEIDGVEYRRNEIENFDNKVWLDVTTHGDLANNKKRFLLGLKEDIDMEWISVKDRLPEERIMIDGYSEINEVLICGIFSTTGRKEVHTGFYGGGTWYIGDMCGVGGEVLAWMTKPEPCEF